MTERYAAFANPLFDSMNAGLRVPQGAALGTPAVSVGTDNLSPSAADFAVQGEAIGGPALRALSELRAPKANPNQKYYYPTTDEFYAGGRLFKRGDIAAMMDQSVPPIAPPPGGMAIPDTAFANYLNTLSERRSTGELLGLGARQVGETVIGGLGSLAELAGATEVGPAVRGFAQSAFGQTPNEQLRGQLINENSSLYEKIVDAAIQSGPSLVAVLAGGGAAGLGLKAAGAGASAITAGATAGAAGVSFPMHISSFYDAAVRNNYDVTDPAVKGQILGGAITNTMLDSIVPGLAARALSRPVQEAARAAGEQVARSAMRNALAGARRGALVEGITEATQTFLEATVFDPQVRSMMTASDWKALAPYIADTYGENLLVSLGAGALLGAPVGGATHFRATGQIDASRPESLTEVADAQATTKEEAPQAAPEAAPAPSGPLAIPFDPSARTIGVIPVAPEPGQLTLGPQERAGRSSPLDPRTAPVLEGELIATPPAARLRRGLPAPEQPTVSALPPPVEGEPNFYAGPQGVSPADMAATEPSAEAAPVATPAERLRVGMAPRPQLLSGQTTDTAFGNQLRAAIEARRAAEAQAAARQQAAAEAARQAQIAERQRAAQIEDAYAQRAAQADMARMDTALALQNLYVDADTAWESFRPQDGKKQSGVLFLDLTPVAQREWMAAVQQGTQSEALYKQLRQVGKPTPIIDVPTLVAPAAAAPKATPKATPRANALAKKQRAVVKRVQELTPEQQSALLAELGVDPQGLDELIRTNPDAVNVAIDTVTTPPTQPTPPGKGKVQRQGAANAAAPKQGTLQRGKPRGQPKDTTQRAKPQEQPEPKPEPKPEVQAPSEVTAVANAKGDTATRVRLPGKGQNYYVVELSDGRAVEVVYESDKQQWVFRADPKAAVVGDGLTSKTVAAAVADMANKGTLPDAMAGKSVFAQGPKPNKADTEAATTSQLAGDELIDLEKALGKPSSALVGERLEAAKDLLAITYDSTLDPQVRSDAAEILDFGLTVDQRADLDAAYGRAQIAKKTGQSADVLELKDVIEAYNNAPGPYTNTWLSNFKLLAAKVRKADPTAPVLEYAEADNSPNFKRVDGALKIANGQFSLADYNTLVGATNLDGSPVAPLPAGRVELLVRSYTRKLQRAPKVAVARNQADLKTKNPALYARAKAARGKDDFDTADALGYSFGDGEVLVFTDRIGTEQQLNFVLAHESIGHYGLRAIMPANKFDSVMNAVYNSDPLVKANVDMTVAVRGMSRAEATEEYLADYAAVLDMSVLRRVAAAIKDGLNALGFKFSDDMVRHLVRTARRYVRNGKRDNLFSTSQLFRDIHEIESGTDALGTGRFKEGFKSDNMRTDLLARDVFGAAPRSFEDAADMIKRGESVVSEKVEKFLNKFFSLTTFRAQENPGLAAVVRTIMKAGEISTEVRNRADETMRWALNRELRIAGIRVMGGITQTEQVAAGYLMYTQQDNVRGKVEVKVEAVLKKLRDAKQPTQMYSIVGDNVVENPEAIEAYRSAGHLSLDEAKAILAKDPRYKAIADALTTTHPTWRAYEDGRKAFTDAQLRFVKAQYDALVQDRKNAQQSMLSMISDPGPNAEKEILPQEVAMFNTWAELYYSLYSGGAVTVEDNLVATDSGRRTATAFSKAVNEVILAKGFDTTKEQAIRQFFTGKRVDEFIKQLVDFRSRITRNPETDFAVQNSIELLATAEMSNTSAEASARKMLVQGFTPIVRKQQGHQVRVNAFDAVTGEFVQMETEFKGLAVYRTAGSLDEATQLANDMNAIFSDTENIPEGATDVEIATVDGKPVRTYTIMARAKGEMDFKQRRVIIRAEASAAVTAVTTPLNLNLNEFLRGIRQYGLNIAPSKLEKVVVDMTAQDARARKRLEQTGNPGYQVEGGVTALEAIAQHIDTQASLIGKIQMRPLIDRLMNVKLAESQKLWFGDKAKLLALQDRYNAVWADPNATEADRFLAKAEYTDYAAKMKNIFVTKNGVEANLGNKYLSEAHELLTFINGNRDINDSDWGSGPLASWARRWIGSSQLGGTLAQPIMNNIGPFTNFIPWLMSYNSKNGFGGGAGFKNAYVQYLLAFSDVGGGGGVSFSKTALEMHTAEYWDEVATGMREHPGVSTLEAEFIANETRSGVLTPAQANSLLGTSRNYATNPAIRRALDKWMFFYLSSEQATRRASALAAFRVEMSRQLTAAGLTEAQLLKPENAKLKDQLLRKATEFAADGVRFTLGEYGTVNRPAAWRSGLQSFLYMYKVWPTTTIQTMKRLDTQGRVAMILPLLIFSGLSGLPFFEDAEDILDTILQKLGMSMGSVRLEAAKLIDSVLPGMSPYVLNGVMSNLIGTDAAGRFSSGDFLPGSGALLSGQDPWQSAKEVLGPAWGFIEGAFKGGTELIAAPFSDTATFTDAARQGPITLFRALGDAYAYASAGAVIDKRGYVIEDDVTIGTLVSRVFGFTPASVAAKYELIRLAKRETDYQKQTVAKFRTGLLKAELEGDTRTAASIRRTVAEWNADTKGTLLEIRNFEKNYRRLKKLATMGAKERFLKSAGKQNQDAIEFIDMVAAAYD